MDGDPYEDLYEVVRRLAVHLRIRVHEIVLNNRRGRPVLLLPLPPAAAEPVTRDIGLEVVRLLRDAGRPLTGLLILEELLRRGILIGKRTLDGKLANMVSEGDLLNPPAAKPPGYRLPAE
jgi:hypothetical protein